MIFKVHCVNCDVDMHPKPMSDGKFVYTCPLCNNMVTIPDYTLKQMSFSEKEAEKNREVSEKMASHDALGTKSRTFMEYAMASRIDNQQNTDNTIKSAAAWDSHPPPDKHWLCKECRAFNIPTSKICIRCGQPKS